MSRRNRVKSHNCQDKMGREQPTMCFLRTCLDEICTFPYWGEICFTIWSERDIGRDSFCEDYRSSPKATHLQNLAIPHLHACPSVLLKQRIKSKESRRVKQASLISQDGFALTAMWRLASRRTRPPLSTQSPSLRAAWTASRCRGERWPEAHPGIRTQVQACPL